MTAGDGCRPVSFRGLGSGFYSTPDFLRGASDVLLEFAKVVRASAVTLVISASTSYVKGKRPTPSRTLLDAPCAEWVLRRRNGDRPASHRSTCRLRGRVRRSASGAAVTGAAIRGGTG